MYKSNNMREMGWEILIFNRNRLSRKSSIGTDNKIFISIYGNKIRSLKTVSFETSFHNVSRFKIISGA
jgi:hypothetical protein